MADLVAAMGINSPSIYAAFGSKEALFREAVAHYEATDGGFAPRALAEEPTARAAIARMLRDAIVTFTRPGRPRGCLVVLAATNCSSENDAVADYLRKQRRGRYEAIRNRLRRGVAEGELVPDTDIDGLAMLFTTVLQGLSIQARDGYSRKSLLALVPHVVGVLDAWSVR